jgi:hypothetical protein
VPRPHARRTPRQLSLAPVLALTHLRWAPATAAAIAWVDWYAKTSDSVTCTILLGEAMADVTFTGAHTAAFTKVLPEPCWSPRSTYENGVVDNAPPSRDVIFIGGGPDPL